MMSNWSFTFPPSRICLWDKAPIGGTVELSLGNEGQVFIRLSLYAIQLALRHAQRFKTLECFFIANSWVDESQVIVVEVNRFDPGRHNKERGVEISPTSLMPEDIPIRTQVLFDSHPDAEYLSFNLSSLHEALTELNKKLSSHSVSQLNPTSLFSLRIHCSCSTDGVVTVECGCVLPSFVYQVTPIRDIPIVLTALARNLSGPLPISVVQRKVRHGFVTMESSRKVVLLVDSDPKVASLPLIGVWISGVDNVLHPMVWAACTIYAHSVALADRVWGEEYYKTFVVLVYFKGSPHPQFLECQARKDSGPQKSTPPFVIHSAGTELKSLTESKVIDVELCPAKESTALHTLMEAALSSSSESKSRNMPSKMHASAAHHQDVLFHSPLPPPLPTSQVPQRITRDINLSIISGSDHNEHSNHNTESEEGKGEVQPLHDPNQAVERDSPLSSDGAGGTLEDGDKDKLIVFPEKRQSKGFPASNNVVPLPGDLEIRRQPSRTPQDKGKQTPAATRIITTTTPSSTAEASTNTGGSLYFPHPPVQSTRMRNPSSHYSNLLCDEAIGSRGTSLGVENSSFVSHDGSMIKLDVQSFASSSTSLNFGESVSMCEDPIHTATSPSFRESGSSMHGDPHHADDMGEKNRSQEFYKYAIACAYKELRDNEDEGGRFTCAQQDLSVSPPPSNHSNSTLSFGSPVENNHQTLDSNDHKDHSLRLIPGTVSTQDSCHYTMDELESQRDPNCGEFAHVLCDKLSALRGPTSSVSQSQDFTNTSLLGHVKSMDPLYLSDLSMQQSLPPSAVNTMLLNVGVLGLDHSWDENIHQADLIARKYLDIPSTDREEGAATTPLMAPPDKERKFSFLDGNIDQTLALSTTTYQFLEKHGISSKRRNDAVTSKSSGRKVWKPVTERVLEDDASTTRNNVLNPKNINGLPKLI